MNITYEITIDENEKQHNKNIEFIKQEILHIKTRYHECLGTIRNVIISNDLKRTALLYQYSDLDEKARASTINVGKELYDIVINYNNCCFISNGIWYLKSDIGNTLCHEFQHILDHKLYDCFIENYITENSIHENIAKVAKMAFWEFNASYHAQMYIQLMWVSNKYSLETNAQKYADWFTKINDKIRKLNYDTIKDDIDDITVNVYNFVKNLLYSYSLSFGTNAADYERETNKKKINIIVSGIEPKIDAILNEYIDGLNLVLENDEQTIEFCFQHCLDVFDYIKELYNIKMAEIIFNIGK